jgi:hypothetical protein
VVQESDSAASEGPTPAEATNEGPGAGGAGPANSEPTVEKSGPATGAKPGKTKPSIPKSQPNPPTTRSKSKVPPRTEH